MTSSGKIYKGSCFCGAVQFTVSGEPDGMCYCHCESCRRWSAGPVNAFTLWKPEAVQITLGAENIGVYNKTPRSYRKWCKTCGGHIFTEHPGMGLTDVYAAVIPDFPYHPRRSCALPGEGTAHRGWVAEDEGPSEGNGWLGYPHRGITRLALQASSPSRRCNRSAAGKKSVKSPFPCSVVKE